MANARPERLHLDEQGVEIAVGRNILDQQLVPRRFAFEPQLVPRAAEERRVAGFDGLLESLFIHETDHKDGAGGVILNDGRDQSVEFTEIEIHLSIPIKKPAKLSAGGGYLQNFARKPPIARRVDGGGDGRNS